MEEEGSAHSRRGIETRGTTLASAGGVSVSALHPRSPSNPSQLFIHSVNDRPSSVPGTGQTHRENAGRASSSTRQGGPRFPAELRGASSRRVLRPRPPAPVAPPLLRDCVPHQPERRVLITGWPPCPWLSASSSRAFCRPAARPSPAKIVRRPLPRDDRCLEKFREKKAARTRAAGTQSVLRSPPGVS